MSLPRVPEALVGVPFTGELAASFGVSRSALRSEPWRKVLRNVWVHSSVPDSTALRVAALHLVLSEEAFVCGPTAAWAAQGIAIQGPASELVWVGQAGRTKPRSRPGFRMVNVTPGPGQVESINGLRLTTPIRTAFDCGRWLPVPESVVVIDALAHAGRLQIDTLTALATEAAGARGVRALRAAIALADPNSESPMESRVRVLLVTSGLPQPESQVNIFSRAGRFIGRADFAYPDAKLVVEYDGAFHWSQRRADDRRRDAMRAEGWTVIVFSAEDYYRFPARLVDTVRRSLARAA